MRCEVKLTTTVDGKKTRVVHGGDLQISESRACVTYTEENAVVSIEVKGKTITLIREGDYSLRLTLEKGKTLDGVLALGDNEGIIQVKTQRVGYKLTKNTLVLELKYTLLIGEAQEMQLKIEAKGE